MYRLRIGEVYWPWMAGTEEQLFRMAFRFAREWYVDSQHLYDWQDEFLPMFTGNLNTLEKYILVKYNESELKIYFEGV